MAGSPCARVLSTGKNHRLLLGRPWWVPPPADGSTTYSFTLLHAGVLPKCSLSTSEMALCLSSSPTCSAIRLSVVIEEEEERVSVCQ